MSDGFGKEDYVRTEIDFTPGGWASLREFFFEKEDYVKTDTHFTPGGWASLWEFPLTDKGKNDMLIHKARLERTGTVTTVFVDNAYAFEYVPHRKVYVR